MTMQNAERMLTDQPVPPPPMGLIEDIKAEIPDNIEIHPGLSETARVVPWHKRRNLRLAVAAVFVVALTATVSWQMRSNGPSLSGLANREDTFSGIEEGVEPRVRVEPLPVPTEDPQIRVVEDASTQPADGRQEPQPLDSGSGRPSATASEPGSVVRFENDGRREASTEDVADAQSGDAPGPADSVQSVDGEAIGEDRAQIDKVGDQVIPDGAAGAGQNVEVTDEMIEQAMQRSFEGEITVTGSLIPRADLTALSPVTVMETPSSSSRHLSNRPSSNWRQRWGSKEDGSGTAASKGPNSETGTPNPSTGGTDEPNDQPYGDVLFREYGVNPFIDTEDDRFSTFGLEVDTGSYNVIRRYLMDGNLPPREAVRLEEIVNAFDYHDESPQEGDFGLSAEGAPSPFADGSRYKIVRFGVTARTVAATDRPPAILTFVVDVSGSMDRENRLGLVKKALYELLANLREDDRVGLVIYGSHGQVLLEPSTDRESIRAAIDRLRSGGSTNAEEGLVLAYELADRFRDDEFINRVILCSDGVANVGNTGPESILERIKALADDGIELTTVGFGMGNYNDVLMERLADTGDGRYAYVDTFDEARKLFVEELTGTLFTIGSEAKAQVEFNPKAVSRYRLIGYENRDIADERFRDPTVDAGEIGAGHTATAVYEIKLKKNVERRTSREFATLRVRYRPSGSDIPVELERRMEIRDLEKKWKNASPSLRLATLAAEYGEILKRSYWARTGDMEIVLSRARELAPEFENDKRVADWITLVEAAAELIGEAGDESIEITD